MADQWDAVAAAMRAAVADTVAALPPRDPAPSCCQRCPRDQPGPDPTPRLPGEVLDLRLWKLTLPTGQAEKPTEVEQPELATYSDEWFHVRADGGVVFRARVDGVTTSGSGYPRSELREMDGDDKAAWSNEDGEHVLEVDLAITETPVVKPEVVAVQIHDGDDDVIQIHLSGRRLTVKYADGKKSVVLDEAYQLDRRFTVRIGASEERVRVAYNGDQKADLPLSGDGWYWKVGCYTQSNESKGDAPDAAGEVVVYDVTVTHS